MSSDRSRPRRLVASYALSVFVHIVALLLVAVVTVDFGDGFIDAVASTEGVQISLEKHVVLRTPDSAASHRNATPRERPAAAPAATDQIPPKAALSIGPRAAEQASSSSGSASRASPPLLRDAERARFVRYATPASKIPLLDPLRRPSVTLDAARVDTVTLHAHLQRIDLNTRSPRRARPAPSTSILSVIQEPANAPPSSVLAQQVPSPTVVRAIEGTANLTAAPTIVLGATSTSAPTVLLTPAPTTASTVAPTAAPTAAPTVLPTAAPTAAPTVPPTAAPTVAPTAAPTTAPTVAPTAAPTIAATAAPVTAAEEAPTAAPTRLPTRPPSASQIVAAARAPSALPTIFTAAMPSSIPVRQAVSSLAPSVAPTAGSARGLDGSPNANASAASHKPAAGTAPSTVANSVLPPSASEEEAPASEVVTKGATSKAGGNALAALNARLNAMSADGTVDYRPKRVETGDAQGVIDRALSAYEAALAPPADILRRTFGVIYERRSAAHADSIAYVFDTYALGPITMCKAWKIIEHPIQDVREVGAVARSAGIGGGVVTSANSPDVRHDNGGRADASIVQFPCSPRSYTAIAPGSLSTPLPRHPDIDATPMSTPSLAP